MAEKSLSPLPLKTLYWSQDGSRGTGY